MNASNLSDLVNAGTPATIRFTMADGTVMTPTVVRATVQRFGVLDLITFHEAGQPDHIGALSVKGDSVVEIIDAR